MKKLNLVFLFIFSVFFTNLNMVSACCTESIDLDHANEAQVAHTDCHDEPEEGTSENSDSSHNCHMVCCNLLVTNFYEFTSNLLVSSIKSEESIATNSLYISLYLDSDLRPPIS